MKWEAETFFFSLFLIFSRLLSSLFFFLIQGDAHMLQCYELFMRALKKTWTRTPYANFIENICVCMHKCICWNPAYRVNAASWESKESTESWSP